MDSSRDYIRRCLLCRGIKLRGWGIVLLSKIDRLSYHRSVDGVSRYTKTDLHSVINGHWIKAPVTKYLPSTPAKLGILGSPEYHQKSMKSRPAPNTPGILPNVSQILTLAPFLNRKDHQNRSKSRLIIQNEIAINPAQNIKDNDTTDNSSFLEEFIFPKRPSSPITANIISKGKNDQFQDTIRGFL